MSWELKPIAEKCNFHQETTSKKVTKANGPKRFTSLIHSIFGEINVEERLRVSALFVQVMTVVSRPPKVIHLCKNPWVPSFCLHQSWRCWVLREEWKVYWWASLIWKRFQAVFDTGIKVRFLCLRSQVIFVKWLSLIESANPYGKDFSSFLLSVMPSTPRVLNK